jgi:hypothetical protein
MKKVTHNSDSSFQKEIETIVLKKLSEKYNCDLKTESIILDKKIKVVLDAYTEDKKLLIEVYAGIEAVKAGQLKKVLTDAYKLVFVEKILDLKNCTKVLCFVDKQVYDYFNSNNWYSLSFKELGIKTELVEISNEDYLKLKEVKKLQFR